MSGVEGKQTTLKEASTPYEVPTPGRVHYARTQHREWYWTAHNYEEYVCPDCGRGSGEVNGFDVHHRDGNPRNGAPENLVGLCKRCHAWRHKGKSLDGFTVDEWKDAFLAVGAQDDTSP